MLIFLDSPSDGRVVQLGRRARDRRHDASAAAWQALLLAVCLVSGVILASATAEAQRNRAPPQRPALQAAPAPAPPAAEPAPPPPAAPASFERHVSLEPLPSGGPQDFALALPRQELQLAARLVLEIEALDATRGEVEVRINDRVALRLPVTRDMPRRLDLAIPRAELLRDAGLLRVGVALRGADDARLILGQGSHLALAIPRGAALSVASLLALMPREVLLLLPPGPVATSDAATALQAGLALSSLGHEVRIASGLPPDPGMAPVWTRGLVLVGQAGGPGAPEAAARVAAVQGFPALVLSGPEAAGAARLLAMPWRALAAGGELSVAAAPPATAQDRLPLGDLRGSLAPQAGQAIRWNVDVTMRDLPARRRPVAVEIDLTAPPGRGTATVLLNENLLGTARLRPDGQLRLALPIPPGLLGLENRLSVLLHRPGDAAAPAQLLPSSLLHLGPAPEPAAFKDLPTYLAEGVEVLLDADAAGLRAESLGPALWLLRSILPPAAPVAVRTTPPGQAPRPTGAFLALTATPPLGATPPLRFDDGRAMLSDRQGRLLLDLTGASTLMAAQLVNAGSLPGIWLRLPAAGVPEPPRKAPGLDRGDVALLDGGGVALAWASADEAPLVRIAYPDAPRTWLQTLSAWRGWAVGGAWLLGVALVLLLLRPARRAAA